MLSMSDIVPIVALVLSVVGLAISILNYHRDRPKIRAWADIIWHAQGKTPDSRTPMLRVRIVNKGRRPIVLLNLVLKADGGTWGLQLKPPEFPNQEHSVSEALSILDRHALAQNSGVRLLEGDVMDIHYWPKDQFKFMHIDSDFAVEAERMYVEDFAGTRYRVRNDRKHLETLLASPEDP